MGEGGSFVETFAPSHRGKFTNILDVQTRLYLVTVVYINHQDFQCGTPVRGSRVNVNLI